MPRGGEQRGDSGLVQLVVVSDGSKLFHVQRALNESMMMNESLVMVTPVLGPLPCQEFPLKCSGKNILIFIQKKRGSLEIKAQL